MATQTVSKKSLNPNASPYLPTPTNRFLVYVPVRYCTYNIRLQPLQKKPFFPIIPVSPPQSPPLKKSKYSLKTHIPTGPRVTKFQLMSNKKLNENNKTWKPKCFENKSVEAEKVTRRWKNSHGAYHETLQLQKNTTSLMIKNIPNKYTRSLLIQTLDAHCEAENKKIKNSGNKSCLSAYDFLYLPIDFSRRLNAGFAFVNFTSAEAALRFRDAFNGKRWELFGSKVAEISRARIQGKAGLVNNCRSMNFMYGSEEDMPVWFKPAREGSRDVCSRMFVVGRSFRTVDWST